MEIMKYFLLSLCLVAGAAQADLPVSSGLVMHLDASTIAGSDGDVVAQWNDISGVGNHATQSTTGSQPTLVKSATVFKGKAAVQFDGSNDWMTLPSDCIEVGSFTFFAVAKFDAIDSNQYICAGQDGGGNDRIRVQLDTTIGDDPVFLWRAGSSAWKDITSIADTEAHVFGETSVVEGFLDGVSVATAGNTSTENPTAFNLGSYNRGAKDFFEGLLAEFVVYDRVLTAQEIASVSDYLAMKYILNVSSPTPANGDVNVGVSGGESVAVTLGWNGAPASDLVQLDPQVKKHYLYMSTATDPNIALVDEITVTDWSAVEASYGPLDLAYDTTYYWQVEEGLDLGAGIQAPGDPNNYLGELWSFTTLPSVPIIDPQPVDTYFAEGDLSAELTLVASTGFMPITYQWYKDGSSISDGLDYSGTDTDTLVILEPDAASEGLYYCAATGSNGGVAESDSVHLVMKAELASYEFEQNVNDSSGANNGTLTGTVTYVSDDIIALPGQAYAVSSDGTASVALPLAAYPKIGFGNGIDSGTISLWVNTSATATQAAFGTFNDTDSTALLLEAPYSSAGIVRLYLRDADGTSIDCRASDTGAFDGKWHNLVIVLENSASGSSVTIYCDGASVASATAGTMEMTAWEFPMSVLARSNRAVIDENFNGMIDDLVIYNYAMEATEIAQNFYDITGIPACILDYASGYDFTGPEGTADCKVDIYDFASFATVWLDSGLYPVE